MTIQRHQGRGAIGTGRPGPSLSPLHHAVRRQPAPAPGTVPGSVLGAAAPAPRQRRRGSGTGIGWRAPAPRQRRRGSGTGIGWRAPAPRQRRARAATGIGAREPRHLAKGEQELAVETRRRTRASRYEGPRHSGRARFPRSPVCAGSVRVQNNYRRGAQLPRVKLATTLPAQIPVLLYHGIGTPSPVTGSVGQLQRHLDKLQSRHGGPRESRLRNRHARVSMWRG